MRLKITLIFCFLLFTGPIAIGQERPRTTTFTPQDTASLVEILKAEKLEYRRIDSVTELQILAGRVQLKQGNSFFYCDSCVINNFAGLFEAFGNVHINDNDTADVYSDYLLYKIKSKIAELRRNVRLTDGQATLTTQELDYDLNTKIGLYRKGGRVVNKKTVLTSEEGIYYSDLKDVYFLKKVELKDTAYYVQTDSLLYNTESETARFIARTFIEDSSKRTIETSEGFYNLRSGKAEFGKRSVIRDGSVSVTGDNIAIDDSTKIMQISGRGILKDTAEGRIVLGDEIFLDQKKDAFLATKKPLMIVKQDEDSIYISADTLFSARLSDLFGSNNDSIKTKDTIHGTIVLDTDTLANQKKDSTDRYFEAFRNVRIFSDSMQAVCDSMFYSFKDSTFRLFYKPVVWNKENQVTGDTILVFTRNKKADRLEVFNNSFLINRVEPEVYNQVKSRRLDAWFTEGDIDSARARGQAESIYFLQDEDSAFTGINQSQSELIDVYFFNRELKKIVPRSFVKGTLWPIRQKTPGEMRLENFQWLDAKRPKTKYDLFE